MAKVGELNEIQGEVTLEWKISNFFPISDETDKCYKSPLFYFSGISWEIQIYPNGQTHDGSENFIGIYIMKKSSWSPASITCSFSMKTSDLKIYEEAKFEKVFHATLSSWGFPKIISRADLLKKKVDLTASDDIILSIVLKNSATNPVTDSLFSRLQKMGDDFKEMYMKVKKTDFLFKLKEQNIGAHRLVLEARSPVFAAMLNNDTKENETGEISISDIDSTTLNYLLLTIYSGDINGNLTTKGAFSLYAAADKYGIEDVKQICSKIIIQNLSVESVCDVIKFSDSYHEKKINRLAKEYFKENADKILDSAAWDTFMKDNHNISVELLATVVKNLYKK